MKKTCYQVRAVLSRNEKNQPVERRLFPVSRLAFVLGVLIVSLVRATVKNEEPLPGAGSFKTPCITIVFCNKVCYNLLFSREPGSSLQAGI